MITAGFFAGLYFLGRQVRLRVDYIQSTSSLTGRKILLAPGMGGEKAPGSTILTTLFSPNLLALGVFLKARFINLGARTL